jgi:hypothetical protein
MVRIVAYLEVAAISQLANAALDFAICHPGFAGDLRDAGMGVAVVVGVIREREQDQQTSTLSRGFAPHN